MPIRIAINSRSKIQSGHLRARTEGRENPKDSKCLRRVGAFPGSVAGMHLMFPCDSKRSEGRNRALMLKQCFL